MKVRELIEVLEGLNNQESEIYTYANEGSGELQEIKRVDELDNENKEGTHFVLVGGF